MGDLLDNKSTNHQLPAPTFENLIESIRVYSTFNSTCLYEYLIKWQLTTIITNSVILWQVKFHKKEKKKEKKKDENTVVKFWVIKHIQQTAHHRNRAAPLTLTLQTKRMNQRPVFRWKVGIWCWCRCRNWQTFSQTVHQFESQTIFSFFPV